MSNEEVASTEVAEPQAELSDNDMYSSMFGNDRIDASSLIHRVGETPQETAQADDLSDGTDVMVEGRNFSTEDTSSTEIVDDVNQAPTQDVEADTQGTEETGIEREFRLRGEEVKKVLDDKEYHSLAQKGLDYDTQMNKLDIERRKLEEERAQLASNPVNNVDDSIVKAGQFIMDLQKTNPDIVNSMLDNLERANDPQPTVVDKAFEDLSTLYTDEKYNDFDMEPFKKFEGVARAQMEAGKQENEFLRRKLEAIEGQVGKQSEFFEQQQLLEQQKIDATNVSIIEGELAKVKEKYNVNVDSDSQETRDFVVLFRSSYNGDPKYLEDAFVKAYGLDKKTQQEAKETKVRESKPKSMNKAPTNQYRQGDDYTKIMGDSQAGKIKLIPRSVY